MECVSVCLPASLSRDSVHNVAPPLREQERLTTLLQVNLPDWTGSETKSTTVSKLHGEKSCQADVLM